MIRRKVVKNMAARKPLPTARNRKRYFADEEMAEVEVKEEAKVEEKPEAEQPQGEELSLKEENLGNLISILDPEKVDGEVVDAIAETTNTSKETVEGLIELVATANEEAEENSVEEATENFSRKAKRLFMKERRKKAFSKKKILSRRRAFAEEGDEDKELAAASAIVGAIDEVAMAKKAAEAVAGIINAATGIKEETIENLVEMSKDSFACGVKFAAKAQNKAKKPSGVTMKKMSRPIKRMHIDEMYDVKDIGKGPEFDSGLEMEDISEMTDEEMLFARREATHRKLVAQRKAFAQKLARRRALARMAQRRKFAEGAEGDFVPMKAPNPDKPVAARKSAMPEAGAKDSTVASQLPLRGTPGIQQNPMNARLDPKEGEAMQSAVPAGEAMATQNELATVQNVTKVPAAASNFQRRMAARSGQKDEFAVLRSVLGDKYIP